MESNKKQKEKPYHFNNGKQRAKHTGGRREEIDWNEFVYTVNSTTKADTIYNSSSSPTVKPIKIERIIAVFHRLMTEQMQMSCSKWLASRNYCNIFVLHLEFLFCSPAVSDEPKENHFFTYHCACSIEVNIAYGKHHDNIQNDKE